MLDFKRFMVKSGRRDLKCRPLGLNRRGFPRPSRRTLGLDLRRPRRRRDGRGAQPSCAQEGRLATCSPQFVRVLNIVFRITSSFRMQAVIANCDDFPFRFRRA